MDPRDLHLPQNQLETLERFIAACQADERILAAFIGGSNAGEVVDRYSDLDLFFITTEAAYADFLAEKESFIRLLGDPLFLEDFGVPHGYLTIYANGTEADIFFYRENHYEEAYGGAITVLLDKKGILAGVVFPVRTADPQKQVEVLRQNLDWFWHDLGHFIKAMGRRQLWFAFGELEILRQSCVNLARLDYNFSDYFMKETYFKVDRYFPVERLAPLAATICPLEYGAMLQAGLALFDFYRSLAPDLAKRYGLTYGVELERMARHHLDELPGPYPQESPLPPLKKGG
jgi:hypothetical protein